MPSVVVWLTTARCNLRCPHCYASRFEVLSELGSDEKLRVAKEIAELGVEWVAVSGGEPLLDGDFFKLAGLLRELGCGLSVSTNLTLLSEEAARRLSRLEAYVYVSVDGPKWVHESLRGPGTFERLARGVELLRGYGVEFGTVMAVSRLNYRRVREGLELALEFGADSISLIPVMPSGRAAERGLAVSAEEYLEAIKLAEGFARDYGLVVSLWCTPFAYLVSSPKHVRSYFCRSFRVVDVDPSGRLLACDVVDVAVSSVRGRGFAQALAEYQRDPFIRSLVRPSRLPDRCAGCRLASACKGGCFARSMLLRGDPNAGDPLCPRARLQ